VLAGMVTPYVAAKESVEPVLQPANDERTFPAAALKFPANSLLNSLLNPHGFSSKLLSLRSF